MDKLPWETVKEEILHKGLAADVADRLESLPAGTNTTSSMKQELQKVKGEYRQTNAETQKGVEGMVPLEYLTAYGVSDYMIYDLTLAHGLDYYTGSTYKVAPNLFSVDQFTAEMLSKIGSIAVGGCCHNSISSFGSIQMPCIGVSVGIDRILIMLNIFQKDQTETACS